jgi:hypothetical protein
MQIAHPIQVYLLAFLFLFLPPNILLIRVFSALWVFTACLLLGLLAERISLRPMLLDKLEGASSLALLKNSLYVVDPFSARVSRIELEKK